MTLSFSGIENLEFYSGHYLDAVLEGDLKQQFDTWSDAERDHGTRPPWKALDALANGYFQSLEAANDDSDPHARLGHARDFHANLLAALGYQYQPEDVALNDNTVLPVISALERDGRPYLWILDAPFPPSRTEDHDPLDEAPRHLNNTDPLFQARLPKESFRELLDETLFRSEQIAGGGPRWVLFLSGNQALLAERNKWLQGRLLRFSFTELLRRRDQNALKAVCGLLHKDVLAPDSGLCLHDTLDENSHKHAFAVSGDLKHGIRRALELLANEAVHWRRENKKAVYSNDDFAQKLTSESLTWLYRLLFLFYVEARSEELEAVPMRSDTYRKGYSLETLRDLELVPLHTEKTQNGFYLHDSLTTLFGIVQGGFPTALSASDRKDTFGFDRDLDATTSDAHGMRVTALHSPLFDDDRLDALKGVRFRNIVLQEVLQLLSLSKEQSGRRNAQRGRISYAQLGINQLGAVYESLLSYTGFFAQEDLYEVANKKELKDAAGKSREELQSYFVAASRIGDYEEDEMVRNEHDKKLVHPKGTFLYRLAGRHREKSASYYTPEVLTRFLVNYSLKELLWESNDDGTQGAPKFSAKEILQLTICEPAMGSGAFLLEAVDQLADAYLERIQEERGEQIPPGDYQKHKRRAKARLATNNCHGVDLNPVAVELGKTSLWLGTMHEGGKCPWFGLRLATGNSLIGARRQVFSTKDVTRSATRTNPNWLGLLPESVSMLAADGPPLGEQGWQLPPRPRGSIYHFLLPADGMAPFDSDKVIKGLLPDAIQSVKRWRTEFTKPFTKGDAARLDKLSDSADKLWAEVCRERALAIRESTDHIPVWGEDDWHTAQPEQLEVRDQEAVAAALESTSSAYRRIKLAMDAWCALWFWPLEHAALLPTREVWLRTLELILIGEVDANVAYAQGGLFTGKAAKQGALALDAKPTSKFELTTEATGERLARLKALSSAFEERRRDSANACGLADVAEIVAAEPMLGVAEDAANRLRFHHWELRFAEAFAERGGFDLVLGNPPWIKLAFSAKSTLSDHFPHVATRPTSATKLAANLAKLLASSQEARLTYLTDACETLGQQTLLTSYPYFPQLNGQQPNLYKAFIAQSLAVASRASGVIGLVHPQGVYDHKAGAAWRQELLSRLRFYFQFENQWPLFAEVLHTRKFLACIYGPEKHSPQAYQISNLVHPSTVDACFKHDGRGELPTQRSLGSWNISGHARRVISINAKLLSLAAQCFPDADGGRMVNLYATDHIDLLQAVSNQPRRIRDLGDNYVPSEMLHERSSQDDHVIARDCAVPDSLGQWVVSGPHIYLGTIPYQTANRGCRNPLDYTRIDLASWDPTSLPRSPYSLVNKAKAKLRTMQGKRETSFYRVIARRMVDPSAERTLSPAVLPPGPLHIDACFSLALPTTGFAAVSWPLLSVAYDYWVKATGKTNFRRELADTLPILPDSSYSTSGQLRLLLLACTNESYRELWESNCKLLDESHITFPLVAAKRLATRTATKTWNPKHALLSDFERRAALLEIDVLAAKCLGLGLDTLKTVYRTSFGTLFANESNNLYDQHGRLIPTANTANGNPCVSLVKLADLLKEQADFDIHREYHPGSDDTEQLLAKTIRLAKREADILGVNERCTVADLMTTTEVRWSSADHPEGRPVPLLGLRYTDPGLEPRKERVYPTPWTRHSREADYEAAWLHFEQSLENTITAQPQILSQP